VAFAELVFWEILLSELSTSQSRPSLLQCLENMFLFFCFREILNKLTEAVGNETSDPVYLVYSPCMGYTEVSYKFW